MKDTLIQIQVLYEIAMSIGNHLDLRRMLKESLTAYLRKLNCAAGAVLKGRVQDGSLSLSPVYVIPKRIEQDATFQAAMQKIPEQLPVERMVDQRKRLPFVEKAGGKFFHIFDLPDFGILMLLKSGRPLNSNVINDLSALNKKLANACISCLRQDRIQTIANDLKHEVNERKKAESALGESHERLLTILDSIDAMVHVAEIDSHNIIFMNQRMMDAFGQYKIGEPCYKVMHDIDTPCPHCGNVGLVESNDDSTSSIVWEDYNPIIDRWCLHQAKTIKWFDGRKVRLQFTTDISKLKQLEHERIDAAHKEQAQRLESLGTLAGGVAHEFNNLLMGMLGNVSLMKFDLQDSHPHQLNLSRIENSIREATELTDKLLGYARKGRLENVRINLNSLLNHLVENSTRLRDGIAVHLDLAEDLSEIEVDQRQIEHALLGLIDNAADAMPDGGDLRILTSNVPKAQLEDKPFTPQADYYVRIQIQDTGVGMTPETVEHIFDPFFTTKTSGRGAGLGLAAAYGIIKGHSGFIEVESSKGEGTEIVLHLPAIPKELNDSLPSEKATAPTCTILLVDDEDVVLDIGRQMLEHLGHTVIEAQSGEEAISEFEKYKARIDLIILDIVMPGLGGTETYSRLKAIDPQVRVLISSGFTIDGAARSLLMDGANDFLQKPFSIQELSMKIQSAVGSE